MQISGKKHSVNNFSGIKKCTSDYICEIMRYMQKIYKENYSLKRLNTFGCDVKTRHYAKLSDPAQIKDIFKEIVHNAYNFMILGEGSNILFINDFEGMVVHNVLKGLKCEYEDNNKVVIKVASGENWDDFVAYCVKMNYGGIENLSLIPGSAGSSPVQNIGAYGVEVKDRIIHVEGYLLPHLEYTVLKNEECRFSYRDSIFRNELKNRFLITAVVFSLDKHPVFELRYDMVNELFHKKDKQNLVTLRETIMEIRKSKLPDPKEFGNAGSFFKNPVISCDKYERMKNQWPDFPGHPSAGDSMKISAAWLIEKSGWKGVREGDAGIWNSQPLVIVNYGCAGGKEIFNFSEKIRKSVYRKFRIKLEREVYVSGN